MHAMRNAFLFDIIYLTTKVDGLCLVTSKSDL